MPLSEVTGRCPTAQLCWGYKVAKKDLRKLQPMLDILKSLIRGGLTGADLLHTFVSHRVQLLRRWEMTPWRYLGHGCPNRSLQAELEDAEVDTHVWWILALVVNQRTIPSLISMREGFISPWVSPLELAIG
jgi:hypothetical protein